MTDGVTWHRVMREDGRAVLSGKTAKAPGRGVWVAALERAEGGQTTKEAIAVDGVIVFERMCYCGQDRNAAWVEAGRLLMGVKRGKV